MPHINILTWHNGSGLERDAQCLEEILTKAGFTVTQTNLYPSQKQARILWLSSTKSRLLLNYFKLEKLKNLVRRGFQIWRNYHYQFCKKVGLIDTHFCQYDINLFLELIDSSYFHQAKKNCFIPNQEWFSIIQKITLKSCDHIICKTLHAYDIFQRFDKPIDYVSFTSQDQNCPEITTNYNACLHLAGRSSLKGTQVVLDIWRRHPEWPTLTIVRHTSLVLGSELPVNIQYIQTRIDHQALTTLQNQCGIRIQPSEVEGFGHVLAEGMSCGSVMVTTDAPPMNEIVAPDRGILVAYNYSTSKGLGQQYYVDSTQLEQRLNDLFQLSLEERHELGDRSRAWYLQNDAFFRQRIVEVMTNLLTGSS